MSEHEAETLPGKQEIKKLPAGVENTPAGTETLKHFGKYEIESLLGQGGMGTVYKAFDPGLKRHVALKVIRGNDPALAARFLKEAQAQASIDHDHVCRVYEVGTVDSAAFIAMDFIEGSTLGAISEGIPLEEKLRLIRDVAVALHSAHKKGLIHRDIKPANIMVKITEEGSRKPYLMDFGLARESEAPGMTVSG